MVSKKKNTSKPAKKAKPAKAGKSAASKVAKKKKPAKVKSAKKTNSSKASAKKVVINKSNEAVFKLGPSMDIAHVEKMFVEVKKYLSQGNDRVFDASDVERITTPCIQVLISVANRCEIEGKKFKLLSPSDAFCKAMEDLGLNNELNYWRSK